MAEAATAKGSSQIAISPAYRRYALFVLLLAYISSYVDRQIMGVLVEPIRLEFGLTDTQMGFLGGIAFGIFYATLGIPIAFLADRLSRRNIIALAIAVWSAMTVACAFAIGFWTLAIARIGVGVGEAGSSPPSHSMIADLYPEHQRSGALAIYALGVYIGIMLGFLVGAYVATEYGWRAAFVVVGLPGVLIALIVRFTLVEPPRGHSDGLAAAERGPINVAVARQQIRAAFAHLWQDEVSRHVVIGVTLVSFVGYGGAYWGAAFFMRSHGMTMFEVGVYLAAVIGVAGVIGAVVGGQLADRLGSKDMRWKMWIVALAKILAAPLILWFFLEFDSTVALVVYVPTVLLGAFYLGPSFAMIQSRAPVQMRALCSAIMLFILNIIGLGLGPQLVGVLSDLMAPVYESESLRYALLMLSFINIWGAWHYYRAGRALAARKG
ncbi:MAG: MFS transporter [Alphaproteobacteria bacterium HGW-Alphaproteobacteria-11]|nr:MAG: MFS transporter [Alphaproteobacteria bacterium HGW-Alphaproteobacteria-11]